MDRLRAGVVTTTAEETEHTAQSLAAEIEPNSVIALSGDLGAGKTTFIKGLARAWGIHQTVTSPTYNIYTIYRGSRQLVHVDAYRLGNAEDMEGLMLEEFLREPWCIAIEWPERVQQWLPEEAMWLEFSIEPDHRHRIRLRS